MLLGLIGKIDSEAKPATLSAKSAHASAHASMYARRAFHAPRAREMNVMLLARAIGFWFAAPDGVENINQALALETIRITRLVGGTA